MTDKPASVLTATTQPASQLAAGDGPGQDTGPDAGTVSATSVLTATTWP